MAPIPRPILPGPAEGSRPLRAGRRPSRAITLASATSRCVLKSLVTSAEAVDGTIRGTGFDEAGYLPV